MGVLKQGFIGPDSSVQTEQSFELYVLQEDASEVSLMFHALLSILLSFWAFHAFSSMLLSFWVLNLNKFSMNSFSEKITLYRNLISFYRLPMIVLSTRVSY